MMKQTARHPVPPSSPRRLIPVVVMTACLAGIAGMHGCAEGDDIRSYEVPKVAGMPDAIRERHRPVNSATTEGARVLAAIVPRGQEIWHFKMMGASALVSPQFDAFVKFVEGVKFRTVKDDKGVEAVEPSWTLPAGWTERPGTGMRYRTIIVGESAHGLELTVFRFGPESGEVTSNVRRWAGQVGLENLTDAGVADLTRPIIVDNLAATLVDATGPGAAGDPSMAGPANRTTPPPVPQPAGKPERLVAQPPVGFAEDPNPSQFLISKYDVTKDGKTASLTVSTAGGDIEANLNRWREQVGLPAWDETTIQKAFEDGKELSQAEIAGRRAILIDLTGPESAGENRERILGALTANPSGSIWFIKFRGPADLVGAQKPAFDAFVKSIRFEN